MCFWFHGLSEWTAVGRKAASPWRTALVSHSNLLWHLVLLGSRSGTMGSNTITSRARCRTTPSHSGCLDIGSQDGNQAGSVKRLNVGVHHVFCCWLVSSDSMNVLCLCLLVYFNCLCHHQPPATVTTICHGCFEGWGTEFLISELSGLCSRASNVSLVWIILNCFMLFCFIENPALMLGYVSSFSRHKHA